MDLVGQIVIHGIAATAALVGAICLESSKAIQAASGIYISEQNEIIGLDVIQHGERDYNHKG